MSIPEFVFDNNVNFPQIGDEELITVFYLEATLSFISKAMPMTNKLISFNTYHSGIGFKYQNSAVEFAIDFQAKDLFKTPVPNVEELKKGNIVWNNQTQIYYYPAIDRQYWDYSTYVCTIKGKHLKKMKKFILDSFVPKNPMYVLWSVNTTNGKVLRDCICDNFPIDIIKYFVTLDIPIDYITPFSIQSCILLSDDAIKLDEKKDKLKIISYYLQTVSNLTKLYEQIEKIKADLDNKDYNDARKDYMTLTTTIASSFIGKETIVYTYDENNIPTYYLLPKVNDVSMDYVKTDIKRNVIALDFDGKKVVDFYTDSNKPIESFKCNKNTNIILYTILGIIAIVIILYLTLQLSTMRRE